MALEYYTVKFANDAAGIGGKNAYTNQMAAQGWHIASEAIEQGHMKGDEACCGFMVCAPLAFLAGRTPATIVTTFARETGSKPRAVVPSPAAFCTKCGSKIGNTEGICIRCTDDELKHSAEG